MASQDEKLIAAATLGTGVILLWSAINNKGFLRTTRDIVSGTKPVPGPAENPASLPYPAGTGFAGSGSVSQLAADALQYDGAGYVWGGAPALGVGNWDCSSFVNWCAGHDLGLPIPGYKPGTYTGENHGPPTSVWLLWGGLANVGNDPAMAEAGDLCIWQTHMGIAIGGGKMISAQSVTSGTGISNIFLPGELLFVRRYKTGAAPKPPGVGTRIRG